METSLASWSSSVVEVSVVMVVVFSTSAEAFFAVVGISLADVIFLVITVCFLGVSMVLVGVSVAVLNVFLAVLAVVFLVVAVVVSLSQVEEASPSIEVSPSLETVSLWLAVVALMSPCVAGVWAWDGLPAWLSRRVFRLDCCAVPCEAPL